MRPAKQIPQFLQVPVVRIAPMFQFPESVGGVSRPLHGVARWRPNRRHHFTRDPIVQLRTKSQSCGVSARRPDPGGYGKRRQHASWRHFTSPRPVAPVAPPTNNPISDSTSTAREVLQWYKSWYLVLCFILSAACRTSLHVDGARMRDRRRRRQNGKRGGGDQSRL